MGRFIYLLQGLILDQKNIFCPLCTDLVLGPSLKFVINIYKIISNGFCLGFLLEHKGWCCCHSHRVLNFLQMGVNGKAPL